MDTNDELKRLLEENLELTKENNRLLRGAHRSRWIGTIGRILWWGFIIIGSYYLFEQYVHPLLGGTATSGTSIFPTQAQMQEFIKQYQVKQ